MATQNGSGGRLWALDPEARLHVSIALQVLAFFVAAPAGVGLVLGGIINLVPPPTVAVMETPSPQPSRPIVATQNPKHHDTVMVQRVVPRQVSAPPQRPRRGVPERISRPFGWGRDPFTGRPRFHGGVDLPAPYGTSVHAADDGRVTLVNNTTGYGLQVIVAHARGRMSRYAHLSSTQVSVNERVARGQVLGRVGSSGRATGPHLHLETIVGQTKRDPASVLGTPLRSQVLAR